MNGVVAPLIATTLLDDRRCSCGGIWILWRVGCGGSLDGRRSLDIDRERATVLDVVVMGLFVVVFELIKGCLDRFEILFGLLVIHVSLAPFRHNLLLKLLGELHSVGRMM